MKKKYRRAICFSLYCLLFIMALPFGLLGLIGTILAQPMLLIGKAGEWLKTKLRVYDYDPD